MVPASELAKAGFKYLGIPYSTLDCQAFVERCLADCGLKKNLPGSNAWYREMSWTGSPEECRKVHGQIPAGAFLFIVSHDGKEPDKYKADGRGNASHIGIVTGTGEGAIHSSASRGCVAESEFNGKTIPNGGWNMIGLWDKIDYGLDSGGDAGMQTAIVCSANGGAVNFREEPRKEAAVIDRLPYGTVVELLDYGSTWSRIRYRGRSGYMMSEFLMLDDSGDDGDMIQVSRVELQKIYDKIGGLLGLGV